MLAKATIVNQGGRIAGLISAGGVIDNSEPNVITLVTNGVELSSGAMTVINDWVIADTLTVNGQITVDSRKDIKSEGTEANLDCRIIIKPDAAVTGEAAIWILPKGFIHGVVSRGSPSNDNDKKKPGDSEEKNDVFSLRRLRVGSFVFTCVRESKRHRLS